LACDGTFVFEHCLVKKEGIVLGAHLVDDDFALHLGVDNQRCGYNRDGKGLRLESVF
jgi:hypothetical protein